MKLWKRTVALMLITLLCSLIPVGVLSLYVTGKRSLNNAAETYGRQLANGKNLLEQFWDNSKYEQMSETGKKSYLEFQFLRCCGEKMLLINSESKEAVVNRTDYEIVSMDNLGLNNKTDSYEYKIQKLNHKYLLLQHALLTNPEGYEILSVRDVTSMFTELRQTAAWFLGIYLAVFCIAGLFIYLMMKRTVQQMEKLQEVAGKQEMLMGALAHEMKTPLTSITVKAYKESGRKILEVADNGRGIPQEELGKITEAFYMVDKSRSRREGGAGLGLALCVKIAEIHGGRLDITSQLGTGTKVRVIFDKKR